MERALLAALVIQPRIGRHLAIHGGNVDDTGIARRHHGGPQRRQGGAHGLEGGGDRGGIGGGEIFWRQRGKGLALHEANIVDQHVQAFEAAEEAFDLAHIMGIEGGGLDRMTLGLEGGGKGLQRRGVTAIDDDMGAGFRQRLDHGRA